MSYFTEGEKRWIKRHTEKTFKELGIDMKSSENKKTINTKLWNKIFERMNVLLKLMKEFKGNYDIDDPEIRWVDDRIEKFNSKQRLLTKEEMKIANTFWRKYNGKFNVKKNG